MEVEEAAEAEEAAEVVEEEEPHNHNNPSRWPKTSELWDLHPPSTMETELKPTIGWKS